MQRSYERKKKWVLNPLFVDVITEKNKYFFDQVENRILTFITENLLEAHENYYKELMI